VGIAAAGRANAPIVTGAPALAAAIDGAIRQQAYLVIYDTGGQPAEVAKGSLELTAKNGPARADEQKVLETQIETALQGVRSKTPEANPLQALALASAAVKSAGETGTVVLADSGLQTIGALNYTEEGMLLADPEELADAVAAAGQLPDLSGITVALTGIGDTAAPQQPLDTATRTRLQEQWRALMTRAGAACVYVDPMPNGLTAPTGVPDVAEVTPPPAPEYDLSTPIPLRGDVLAYQDNSPQLVDPEAARAALAPLVTALQGTQGSIKLTGTTASGGTEEGRLQLSAQRAETAKQLLVAMGVDAQRITTTGVGTNFPGFREDTDDSGRQIPEVAALNRSVIVEVQQP
jgi:outer membrane protein OmpA-like peptidoglycan-associated protein